MKQSTRLVYVATPYAGIRCGDSIRDIAALKIARAECKKVKEAGFIPISPILAWNGVYSEDRDRDELLRAGLELMIACSYVYFSNHPDSEYSVGMKLEREYANEIGLSVIDFDSDEPERVLF